MALPILWVGMDVHKDFVMIAVFRGRSTTPLYLEKVSFDPNRLRRFLQRLAGQGEIRSCYEASGAGYVLQRWMQTWGYACDLIAPSLIPSKAGDRRKHDKRDAIQLARLYRAGELTTIHIPTEAEESVRDLVRCRATFQREILKSRHYILKFLQAVRADRVACSRARAAAGPEHRRGSVPHAEQVTSTSSVPRADRGHRHDARYAGSPAPPACDQALRLACRLRRALTASVRNTATRKPAGATPHHSPASQERHSRASASTTSFTTAWPNR